MVLHGNVADVSEAIGCICGFVGRDSSGSSISKDTIYECIINDRLGRYKHRILSEFKLIEGKHEFVRRTQFREKDE